MRINTATCKISYPQVVIGRLTLISNDLTTSFRRLLMILLVHFEYEHELLVMVLLSTFLCERVVHEKSLD